MPIVHAELRPLDTVACLRKLEAHSVKVGMLAVVRAGAPDLYPMNYVVDRGVVTVRTDAGAKLDALLAAGPVAFGVTEVDSTWAAGWSVVVHGRARLVADPTESERLCLLLGSWDGGDKPFVFHIDADTTTGRTLG